MSFDNAYRALTEEHAGAGDRWAFGTGFEDPLAGVDTTVPAGVDAEDLAAYCAMLGDDALVSAQRLTEWVTRAPELEEEVALANIALDLLGQARLLLSRAGQAAEPRRSEDELAYFRDATEFRNVRLVEPPGGDFAESTVRLLVLSAWRLALFVRLRESADPVLAAIASKGVKELTYHRDYAARWLVRLGDGTAYSHERARAGLAEVWPFVEELFLAGEVERRMAGAGVAVDPAVVRPEFHDVLRQVLREATLTVPYAHAAACPGGSTGRVGVHTPYLAPMLGEMQGLARAHPGATW